MCFSVFVCFIVGRDLDIESRGGWSVERRCSFFGRFRGFCFLRCFSIVDSVEFIVSSFFEV